MILRLRHTLYYTLEGGFIGILGGLALTIVYLAMATILGWAVDAKNYLPLALQGATNYSITPFLYIAAPSGFFTGWLVSWRAKSYEGAALIGGIVTGILTFPMFCVGVTPMDPSPLNLFFLPVSISSVCLVAWIGQRIYQRANIARGIPEVTASPLPISPYVRSILTYMWLASLIYLGIHGGYAYIQARQGPTIEEHEVQWDETQPFDCEVERVELRFRGVSDFRLDTCSESLLNSLRADGGYDPTITWERSFVQGVWEYKVISIGSWQGHATFTPTLSRCAIYWDETEQAFEIQRYCQIADEPIRSPFRLQ